MRGVDAPVVDLEGIVFEDDQVTVRGEDGLRKLDHPETTPERLCIGRPDGRPSFVVDHSLAIQNQIARAVRRRHPADRFAGRAFHIDPQAVDSGIHAQGVEPRRTNNIVARQRLDSGDLDRSDTGHQHERVGLRVAVDRVNQRGGRGLVDVDAVVARRAADEDRVFARPAVEGVRAASADHRVVAAVAVDRIVTGSAFQEVVPGAAIEDRIGGEEVVAFVAVQANFNPRLRAVIGLDRVVAGLAADDQQVAAGPAHGLVDIDRVGKPGNIDRAEDEVRCQRLRISTLSADEPAMDFHAVHHDVQVSCVDRNGSDVRGSQVGARPAESCRPSIRWAPGC